VTEEIIEKEEIREVEGVYVPDGSQLVRIFFQSEDVPAYSKMLEFINWVKPSAFNVVCGNDQNGNQAVKLTYIRQK
jgi:hypothetical protein